MVVKSFINVAAIAAVTGLGASIASAQITIPTVPIGNPGNAADPNDGDPTEAFGSVAYTYNIGTTEVTNAQYAAFLNAKARSDPFNLYSPSMAGSLGGITRSGSPGSYTYATVSGRANNPVNFVTFWDATRFANWLHNGQGNGSTETGAYTLGGVAFPVNDSVTRNAGWQWAVTSEDEWYKAAYHQPASAGGDSDDYWAYTTQSNAIPTTAQANFGGTNSNPLDNTRPVGSYAANYYGTFDMGGNVWEWNEEIFINFTGSNRGLRGGAYYNDTDQMRAVDRIPLINPTSEDSGIGFRVSQIPAPGSVALLAIGGLMAARRRR